MNPRTLARIFARTTPLERAAAVAVFLTPLLVLFGG